MKLKLGFTLLEVLVALVVMTAIFTIIYSTFSGTVRAWTRGTELLDDLHHGDFVMEQLTSALR
ncbi:MAG: prepilin-type N-terminal cleavage/methylation domain-containing protein, partial [Lentisphaerota bacterium]